MTLSYSCHPTAKEEHDAHGEKRRRQDELLDLRLALTSRPMERLVQLVGSNGFNNSEADILEPWCDLCTPTRRRCRRFFRCFVANNIAKGTWMVELSGRSVHTHSLVTRSSSWLKACGHAIGVGRATHESLMREITGNYFPAPQNAHARSRRCGSRLEC